MARAGDAEAITRIYNAGIAERSATFETEPRTVAQIQQRLLLLERYPLLVAEDASGSVVGWAGLAEYRPRECYAGIAEFSIYLDRVARGQGTGKALLSALIDAAAQRGFWKLVSRIFPVQHGQPFAVPRLRIPRGRHLRTSRATRRPLARRGHRRKTHRPVGLRCKGSGNAGALADTARGFRERYQQSSWAKKASVWGS